MDRPVHAPGRPVEPHRKLLGPARDADAAAEIPGAVRENAIAMHRMPSSSLQVHNPPRVADQRRIGPRTRPDRFPASSRAGDAATPLPPAPPCGRQVAAELADQAADEILDQRRSARTARADPAGCSRLPMSDAGRRAARRRRKLVRHLAARARRFSASCPAPRITPRHGGIVALERAPRRRSRRRSGPNLTRHTALDDVPSCLGQLGARQAGRHRRQVREGARPLPPHGGCSLNLVLDTRARLTEQLCGCSASVASAA